MTDWSWPEWLCLTAIVVFFLFALQWKNGKADR